jgi:hypothetical protein
LEGAERAKFFVENLSLIQDEEILYQLSLKAEKSMWTNYKQEEFEEEEIPGRSKDLDFYYNRE